MSSRVRFLPVVLAAGMILAGNVRAVSPRDASEVVVIPARYTVVKFAFDLLHLRPVTLVAVQEGRADSQLLLHVWERGTGEWAGISLEEYRTGAAFPATAQSLILIGDTADVPADLEQGTIWPVETTRIPSLQIVTVVNELDNVFGFTPWEWRWLAARHGLELEDLNRERRRYGRYGKPGSRRAAPMPPPEAVEPPPEEPAFYDVPEPEKGVPAPAPAWESDVPVREEVVPEDK